MLTFEKWMKEVDGILNGFVGMDSNDLPDYAYRDCYDDGIDPEEAAYEALENADCPMEEMGW